MSLAVARAEAWSRAVPLATAAWTGGRIRVPVRIPASANGTLRYRLELEGGSERGGTCELSDAPVLERGRVARRDRVACLVDVPERPPPGYHRLVVSAGQARGAGLLICSPRRAAPPSPPHGWGAFSPAHALRTGDDWGVGDLTSLGALLGWVRDLGGSFVGTLPIFAAFLDEPYEPSPYSPASRLFWNELLIDVTRIPDLASSPEARDLLASRGLRAEVERLRAGRLADPRAAMRLKRSVLDALSRSVHAGDSPRRRELDRWATARLRDYAAFRAAAERRRTPWQEWPVPERDGGAGRRAGDRDARRYHRYVQWTFEQQLAAAAGQGAGRGLLLDLPLGVHPASYDTWRERDLFAAGAAAGAPPDAFATAGQNWSFPPLLPHRLEETGFAYLRETLGRVLPFARVLRVDHVMGLHRMFWIPRGLEAREGVYVRYPTDALYAVLCLESHRHGVPMVGEDLGTVPRTVRTTMARHGIERTFVVQFELKARRQAISPVPEAALATVNTHDMPPFAAFWTDSDLDERRDLGLIDDRIRAREARRRRRLRRALVSFLVAEGWLPRGGSRSGPDPTEVHRACLRYLAASPADLMMANLEDLWGETRAQNVPGTESERPNWLGRSRHAVEDLRGRSEVRGALEEIDALRRAPRRVAEEGVAG